MFGPGTGMCRSSRSSAQQPSQDHPICLFPCPRAIPVESSCAWWVLKLGNKCRDVQSAPSKSHKAANKTAFLSSTKPPPVVRECELHRQGWTASPANDAPVMLLSPALGMPLLQVRRDTPYETGYVRVHVTWQQHPSAVRLPAGLG